MSEVYNSKIYRARGATGNDLLVVDAGGVIHVLSGGSIVVDAGATFTITGVTPGTASASLPMVPDSSNNISGLNTLGVKFLNFAASGIVNLDSETKTCTSNACTSNKQATVVTTESLSTAAGSSQAITITNSLVAAGDLAWVEVAGGTNTTPVIHKAVTTSSTITVTFTNIDPAAALNGTIVFNVRVDKA